MAKRQGFADMGAPPLPHYLGHRERLRERFRGQGADALADYELLEMLLFRAVRRADTKPIAKALIARFGSFAEVLSAKHERLVEVEGVGEQIATELKLVHAAGLRLARAEAVNRPTLGSFDAVVDYCRTSMAFEPREQLRVLFLDKKNRMIADEVLHRGTVDHTPVYPREIMRRALELGSTAVILVHNHPSGDPTPSKADIEMTKQVIDAARPLGLVIHDHLIVGRDGHMSFRGRGLI